MLSGLADFTPTSSLKGYPGETRCLAPIPHKGVKVIQTRVRTLKALGLIAAAALAAGLWVLPPLAFPSPGENDAIALANLSLPLVGAILLASILALVLGYRRRWSSAGPVALGAFLIGVAAALLIGLVTFGNMSDDRFLGLLFLPVLFVPFGIVVLAVGLTVRSTGHARHGLVIGGLATALLVAWVLARGARDWLLAPYAFDILLLIALEAAVVYIAGATRGRPER